MIIDFVPKCVREIANGAKDLCDDNFRYPHFVTLLCALFFDLPSFCESVKTLAFSDSVSTLSRAAAAIPHQSLLRRNRNRVAALLHETEFSERRFVLIVDDTLVRKYGSTLDNCYWFDHSLGAKVKGRCYLVLVVFDTYTGQSFPVSVVLLKGTKHANYQPRIEVLKNELLILKAGGFGKLTVCADSWFAGTDLFEWLEKNQFVFEIEVKFNRKVTYFNKKPQGKLGDKKKIVYPSISDVACSLKRNTAFSGGAPKQIASGVVRVLGSHLRLKFAAVWNTGDSTKDRPFAIYVTNKTSFCASRIWALSRFRWAIECHFRRSKQDFSFDTFPTHSSETAFGLIVLGMFLICSLELSRWDAFAIPLGKQEQRRKYLPLTTWVKRIRAETEDSVFKRAMFRPDKKKSIIEHMNGRKNASYACCKPRDKYKKQDIAENGEELRLSVA